MLKRTGDRPKLAAAATTCLIMLSVIIPFTLIGSAATLQGVGVVQDLNEGSIKVALVKLQQRFGLELDYKPQMEHIKLELDHLETAAENYALRPFTLESEQTNLIPTDIARSGNKVAEAFDKLRSAIVAANADTPKPAWEKTLVGFAEDARKFGEQPRMKTPVTSTRPENSLLAIASSVRNCWAACSSPFSKTWPIQINKLWLPLASRFANTFSRTIVADKRYRRLYVATCDWHGHLDRVRLLLSV